MKIIAEIWDAEGNEPWATLTVLDADVVPAKGDWVVLRSAEAGGPGATSLIVTSDPTMLSSFDGVVVTLGLPDFDDDPIGSDRALRRELDALGWTILAPALRLPTGADDDDLDD